MDLKGKELWSIVLIVSSLIIREMWFIAPDRYINPFFCYDIVKDAGYPINEQTYWSYPLRFLSEIMWIVAIMVHIKKFRLFFNVLLAVQTIELIEYFFTYNQPIWFPGVGITVFKFIVLSVTIVIQAIFYFNDDNLRPSKRNIYQ